MFGWKIRLPPYKREWSANQLGVLKVQLLCLINFDDKQPSEQQMDHAGVTVKGELTCRITVRGEKAELSLVLIHTALIGLLEEVDLFWTGSGQPRLTKSDVNLTKGVLKATSDEKMSSVETN